MPYRRRLLRPSLRLTKGSGKQLPYKGVRHHDRLARYPRRGARLLRPSLSRWWWTVLDLNQ